MAAVYVREDREHPDRDGVLWEFLVTDGCREAPVEACLSGTNGGELGMEVDVATLEALVEKRGGAFARETRLEDMRRYSPLPLRRAAAERLLGHRRERAESPSASSR